MQKNKTLEMVQLAILTAIMIIFAFTPLGFLRVGAIEITFLVLPVAIGACLLGVKGGLVLGIVFGLLSFLQCLIAPTPFAQLIMQISPFATFVMCLVPRVLCGLLSGLVYKGVSKIDKTHVVSYFVTSLATALFNTLFFMTFLVLMFWNSSEFTTTMQSWQLPIDSIWSFVVAFVAVNGVVEAAVNFILGGIIGKAISHLVNKKAPVSAEKTA